MKIGDLVETTNIVQWYDIGIIIELFNGHDPVRIQWTCGRQAWATPRQIKVIK